MKTVILCGGKGRRMYESSRLMPKPLIMIGDKPILWHIMKIYSHQGFREFILCLGNKGGMIKEYFLKSEEMCNDFALDLRRNKIFHLTDKNQLDANIIFADTGLDSMTGARIARIKKYVGDDEDFFVTYGDGVADIDVKGLYLHHKKMNKIGTITVIRPFHKYGIVKKDGESVVDFEEKPKMNDFIGGGFMVFNKKVFEYLSEDKDCVLEKDVLKKLANEGQLAAYHHEGFWKGMDTQKDVDELIEIQKNKAPWEIWEESQCIVKKEFSTEPEKKQTDISKKKDFELGADGLNNIRGPEEFRRLTYGQRFLEQ